MVLSLGTVFHFGTLKKGHVCAENKLEIGAVSHDLPKKNNAETKPSTEAKSDAKKEDQSSSSWLKGKFSGFKDRLTGSKAKGDSEQPPKDVVPQDALEVKNDEQYSKSVQPLAVEEMYLSMIKQLPTEVDDIVRELVSKFQYFEARSLHYYQQQGYFQ